MTDHTLADELARRAAVEGQMRELRDSALRPTEHPMLAMVTMIGTAQLHARMWEGNELTKQRYDQPMGVLCGLLEWRCEQLGGQS